VSPPQLAAQADGVTCHHQIEVGRWAKAVQQCVSYSAAYQCSFWWKGLKR